MYKLRIYEQSDSAQSSLVREEYFESSHELLKRYRGLSRKELYSLNLTVWQLKNGCWIRLLSEQLSRLERSQSWLKRKEKYTAFVETDRDSVELGTFDSVEEARKAIHDYIDSNKLELGVNCSSCVAEHTRR